MNGYLVYSPSGVKRNGWFAAQLIAQAAARGIALELKVVPEKGEIAPEFFRTLSEKKVDFAMVRLIRPELNERLEALGVRTLNNALTAKVANDKWRTFLLAQKLDLPHMETFYWQRSLALPCAFPCVAKSLDGHGGSEVALVRNIAQLEHFADDWCKCEFILQPLATDRGRDIRVYAFGAEAVAAVERTSTSDFRSNYSLGGKVRSLAITPRQREIVRRLHAHLGFDFVGVDFICHNGRWVLNEIEDVVGCRMLYATTSLDAAAMMAEHLRRLP